MYVMDRLFLLSEGRSETSDAQIAGALLQWDTQKTSTAGQFGKQLGISKATLYRFCAKAGFPSFQALIEVLAEEKKYMPFWLPYTSLSYTMPDLSDLVEAMIEAERIVFNGDFSQIHLLTSTFKVLALLGKEIAVCSDWDLGMAYAKLEKLNENDVYVHLDANIRLDLLHEYIVNRPYLIDYECIAGCRGKKFYCSRQISGPHPGFFQIGLEIENRRYVRPYLLELDEKLAQTLMERGKL